MSWLPDRALKGEISVSNPSVDLFLNACGATGPMQLDIFNPGIEEPVGWKLFQPFAIVGRNCRTELLLDHPEVSQRHAYLQMIEQRIYCVDLLSRTGIRWGNEPSRSSGWLDRGPVASIGPFKIRSGAPSAREVLSNPADEWDPLRRRPVNLVPLPEIVLEFRNQDPNPIRWQMRGTLALVGNSRACAVRLPSAKVSRLHASLLRTPLGVWVIDLLGRGGLLVNGTRVRSTHLEDGDQLEIGPFLIRVCFPETLPLQEAAGRLVNVPMGLITSDSQQFAEPRPTEAQQPADATAASDPAKIPLHQELPTINAENPAAPLPMVDRNVMMVLQARTLEKAEAGDSLLLPLLHQFNQMQQQMFDQFHQSMMMMVQMFGTLHRDQMGVIREELDRVYQITQELQSLQTDLAKQSAPVTHQSSASFLARANQAPLAPPSSGGCPIPDQAAAGGGSLAQTSRRELPAPSAGNQPLVASESAAEANAPASSQPADLHILLSRRIAQIQQERQGRWQRILGFLRGKQPEEPGRG